MRNYVDKRIKAEQSYTYMNIYYITQQSQNVCVCVCVVLYWTLYKMVPYGRMAYTHTHTPAVLQILLPNYILAGCKNEAAPRM